MSKASDKVSTTTTTKTANKSHNGAASHNNGGGGAPSDRDGAHAWENVAADRLWEAVTEDAVGVGGDDPAETAEAVRRRRRRLSRRDYSHSSRRVVRDMIRHLYLVIDGSSCMGEKDPAVALRSSDTRAETVARVAHEFVGEYHDQNPLSRLGVILLRDGEAEMLTRLEGDPRSAREALRSLSRSSDSRAGSGSNAPGRRAAVRRDLRPSGNVSLQNGLEVAGRSLGTAPAHGSREVLLLVGASSTCDPGDVLGETLPRLVAAGVRVSCVALAAEMHVCRRVCHVTGGVMGVCMDGRHLRDLVMGHCVPPPSSAARTTNDADDEDEPSTTTTMVGPRTKRCEFVEMGFPTRESRDVPGLIHATRDKKLFGSVGYICPRCQARASDLPTDCAVCGLKLVLAPHLARSFHHLFPVPPFAEIPDDVRLSSSSASAAGPTPDPVKSVDPVKSSAAAASANEVVVDDSLLIRSTDCDRCCYACLKTIPYASSYAEGTSKNNDRGGKRRPGDEREPSLRFRCPQCGNVFCADCDAYLHETLHNCPGCLSGDRAS